MAYIHYQSSPPSYNNFIKIEWLQSVLKLQSLLLAWQATNI